MTAELIKINPTEFGLTEETAQTITKDLAQILSERSVLSAQYAEIITLDIDDPKTAKRAAELRKLVKNNRTKGIENWHKVNKEFYLRGGQFVDAIKRKEVVENERMEEALEQIEKRQEILEKERIAKVQTLRVSLIAEYVENSDKMDLGNMQDDVWEAFYAAKKKEFEDKKEAERLAEIERERLAEEKRLEDERIRAENEKLRKEAAEKEAQLEAERKSNEEKLRIEREKAEKERAEREAILEAERKKAKEEADKIAAIEAEKLRVEREANEKLQAELKAKKDAEEAAEKQRLADEEKARKEAEKLAKAPIKKQLAVWVNDFTVPYAVNEVLNNEVALEIKNKFEAFKNWAKTQVENI